MTICLLSVRLLERPHYPDSYIHPKLDYAPHHGDMTQYLRNLLSSKCKTVLSNSAVDIFVFSSANIAIDCAIEAQIYCDSINVNLTSNKSYLPSFSIDIIHKESLEELNNIDLEPLLSMTAMVHKGEIYVSEVVKANLNRDVDGKIEFVRRFSLSSITSDVDVYRIFWNPNELELNPSIGKDVAQPVRTFGFKFIGFIAFSLAVIFILDKGVRTIGLEFVRVLGF